MTLEVRDITPEDLAQLYARHDRSTEDLQKLADALREIIRDRKEKEEQTDDNQG